MHVEVRDHAGEASRVSSRCMCVCLCAHRRSAPSHLFLSLSPHNRSIYHQLQQQRLTFITVQLLSLTPVWILLKLLLPRKSSAFTFVHVQLSSFCLFNLRILSKAIAGNWETRVLTLPIPLAVSRLCDPDVRGEAPVARAGQEDCLFPLISLFLPDKHQQNLF